MFDSYAFCSYNFHLSNLYLTIPDVVTISLILLEINELVYNYYLFRDHICLLASRRSFRKKFYLIRKC